MKLIIKFFVLTVFIALNTTVYAVVDVKNATRGGDFTQLGVRVTNVTFGHDVPNGTNILYVGVSNYRIPTLGVCVLLPTDLTSTVNYMNSSTGTTQQLQRVNSSGGLPAVLSPNTCNSVEVFRLVSPQTTQVGGDGSIVLNQTVAGDYVVVGAISLSGVDNTSGTTFSPASGNNAAPIISITGTISNDVVLDVLSADFISGLATPSQTERWDGEDFFSNTRSIGAGSTKTATSNLTTMNWTLNDPGQWALAGINLKPAAVSASPASIGGFVANSSGQSLPDSLVIVQNLQSGEQFYTQTDEKGNYIVEELEMGVSYLLTVYNYKYDFEPNQRIVNLLDPIENLNFSGHIRRQNRTVSEQKLY